MIKAIEFRDEQSSRLIVAAVAILLAIALPAAAQQTADPAATLYRWMAPPAADQLAADVTAVPSGMGAVFVPAMTKGFDEPEAYVYRGAERVANGVNGTRIVVPPGSYIVRVGTAPLNQMVSVPVDVTAGNTTVVPIDWGALVVEVVDRNNVPFRGTYELIQVSDKQPYTVGFGADTLQGETIKTILMAPGLYRIVRPGNNYRTRTDFSTVLVPKASVVYYKLVLDEDTGQLLGAGVVPPEELGIVTEASGWSRRVSVGVGVPINSTSNVVGTQNQTSFAGDLTFDTYLIYNKNQNYWSTIFEVEEGVIRFDPENQEPLPVQKTNDRLRFDTLYTWFVTPRVGPYVRFGLLTNIFESRVLVTEPTVVVKHFLDGTQTTEPIQANNDFFVGDAFAPLLLREGTGINVRLIRGRVSSLDWRGGFGLRQSRYNGAFVLDNDRPQLLEYSEVESFNEAGLETTIVGTVRVSKLVLNTNFDLFGDFNEFDQPTVDWRNTVSWRLTGGLSLDYRLDVLKQPQVTDDTQLSQSLQFRYSWGN